MKNKKPENKKQEDKKINENRKEEKSENSMINKILIPLSILLFMFLMARSYMRNVYDTGKNVTKKMEKHLYEEYGEEFDIYLLREVEVGYAAFIQRLADVGTARQDDAYYLSTVTMYTKPSKLLGYNKHGRIYDSQGNVILNEKLNSIVGKEVEKLFGKNHLVVLKMSVPKKALENEGDLFRTRKVKSLTEEEILGVFKRNEIKVEGDIYVFGRVESDEDRENYRKQIFEFVQILKRMNMFDYTSLDIKIYDERIYFLEESQKELSKLKFDNLTYDEMHQMMAKALDIFNDKFGKVTEKEFQNWMNSINKNRGLVGTKGIYLLSNVTGTTYIKNFSMKHVIDDYFDGIKEYDKLEDVRFEGREY